MTLFLWASGFSRQGATGVPLFTTWDSVAGSGRAPLEYLETFRAGADPGSELSHLGLSHLLVSQKTATLGGLDLGSAGVWDRDYGWGVRVRRHFGARWMS